MSVALWCLLIAGLLPILTAGYAKRIGGRYDNRRPRDIADMYEGAARRAHAAHQNGFESFPLFAAAVLLAEMKGGPRGLIDGLAMGFVSLRLVYTWAYIANRQGLRSLVWALALFATIGIFISPLWR